MEPGAAPDPAVVTPPADPAEVSARLGLSTVRLARRLRREAGTDLTPSLLSALAVLDRHGRMTLGSLADHEGVAPPSITRIVNRLEVEGLVCRTTDDTDRRVTWVEPSAAGRALVAESRRRKNAWLAGRIRALDPDGQRRLADALDVLEELWR